MREILQAFNYQITDGSPYQWKCYGPNARFLDFENNIANGSIIFDSSTQFIYQAEVWVKESLDSPYRYIHQDFVRAHKDEANERNVNINIAFDGVKFVDVDLFEDFIEKATAIWRGLPFDKRIQVPIDEDVFIDLAKEAHRQDITINALVEKILVEVIEREKIDGDIVVV